MDLYKCMNTFKVVYEQQSLMQASLTLNVTVSAVSKQLAELEKWANCKLIHRTTRSLNITPAGEEYYLKVQKLLSETHKLKKRQSDSKNLSGHIRIAMPLRFGNDIILPNILKFLKKHPDVTCEMCSCTLLPGLINDQYDILLSNQELESKDVACHVAYPIQIGYFAAKSYLKKNGEPKSPKDLAKHNCLINLSYNSNKRWQFKNESQLVDGNLTSATASFLIEAAKKGLGIIELAEIADVEKHAITGLVPVLPADWPKPTPLYIYYYRYKMDPLLLAVSKALMNPISEKSY